jgi:hypothetical protein
LIRAGGFSLAKRGKESTKTATRGSRSQTSSRPAASPADSKAPPGQLPKKHPLLLALSAIAFIAWLIFLIVTALRG